jgi:hypothetical protein
MGPGVVRNIRTTGQIGDGREAAAVEYVLKNAQPGDIADVIATIDKFAYEKSMLINIGDEKGLLLDAAVHSVNPALALELGAYVGYGALRIARRSGGEDLLGRTCRRQRGQRPADLGACRRLGPGDVRGRHRRRRWVHPGHPGQ